MAETDTVEETVEQMAARLGIRLGGNDAPPSEPEHGTMTMYRKGCRLECCREASRAYNRAKYLRQQERLRGGRA